MGACEEEVSVALQELKEHESQMTREGLMRFSSSSAECTICREDAPEMAAILLGCGHGWYCIQCMTRYVEARLEAGTAGDIPCPDCGASISEKDLSTLLPKKTIFRLYARSIEQRAVASRAIS